MPEFCCLGADIAASRLAWGLGGAGRGWVGLGGASLKMDGDDTASDGAVSLVLSSLGDSAVTCEVFPRPRLTARYGSVNLPSHGAVTVPSTASVKSSS